MAVRPWWGSSASVCSSLHWVVPATFSTVFHGWKTFKAGRHRTLPICHIFLSRFHKRGQGLLQGHLEESLCRVVKKVAFTFTLPINLPGGKSGTLLCVEVLPNQPVDIEGDGSHCSHLPYHPYSVQVRHTCHPLVEIYLSRKEKLFIWQRLWQNPFEGSAIVFDAPHHLTTPANDQTDLAGDICSFTSPSPPPLLQSPKPMSREASVVPSSLTPHHGYLKPMQFKKQIPINTENELGKV